jgi:hypothetical protein
VSNLPPGCTSADIEWAFGGGDPTDLEEKVYALLEDEGVPASYTDRIIEIVAEWEHEQRGQWADAQAAEYAERQAEESASAAQEDGR